MKHVLRNGLMVLGLVVGSVTSATAQVSVGVWLPGVSIGINLPVYPQLVAVPGYPVYYAPQMNSNYFFYDGMYWVYQSDNWYASSWYNGPWGRIGPASGSGLPAACPGALLPGTSSVLPRVAGGSAAALGRTLGQ